MRTNYGANYNIQNNSIALKLSKTLAK